MNELSWQKANLLTYSQGRATPMSNLGAKIEARLLSRIFSNVQ